MNASATAFFPDRIISLRHVAPRFDITRRSTSIVILDFFDESGSSIMLSLNTDHCLFCNASCTLEDDHARLMDVFQPWRIGAASAFRVQLTIDTITQQNQRRLAKELETVSEITRRAELASSKYLSELLGNKYT